MDGRTERGHAYEPIPAAIVAAKTFKDTPSRLSAPFVAACNLTHLFQTAFVNEIRSNSLVLEELVGTHPHP